MKSKFVLPRAVNASCILRKLTVETIEVGHDAVVSHQPNKEPNPLRDLDVPDFLPYGV